MRPAVIDDPLVLDANAVAGDLREIMGVEITTYVARCAHCGNRAAFGTLRAWTHGPGVVLRCVICSEVVIRWVRHPDGPRVDMRGAAFLQPGIAQLLPDRYQPDQGLPEDVELRLSADARPADRVVHGWRPDGPNAARDEVRIGLACPICRAAAGAAGCCQRHRHAGVGRPADVELPDLPDHERLEQAGRVLAGERSNSDALMRSIGLDASTCTPTSSSIAGGNYGIPINVVGSRGLQRNTGSRSEIWPGESDPEPLSPAQGAQDRGRQ